MGGKLHGFLGGVLLTTAAVYYSSAQFKNSNGFVSRTLKDTENIINGVEPELKPIPRQLNFTHRPISETIADIWDDSVLASAKTLYSVDLEKTSTQILDWIKSKSS